LYSLALPSIKLADPAPVKPLVAGDILSCSAFGTLPIYVLLIRNSTVLANTTNTANVRIYKGGNYSCVTSNKFGTDSRVIPVIILGEILF